MKMPRLGPPPVGVRLIRTADQGPQAGLSGGVDSRFAIYQGVSYCDAVRRAGEGEMLLVSSGSIRVCQWSPVVLGLKEPQGSFEEALAPRLEPPVVGLLLAPLDGFPGEPDVVLVRARAAELGPWLQSVGPEYQWGGHGGSLDRSALPLLHDSRATARSGFIAASNRTLAVLARSEAWQVLTRRIFCSRLATAAFEALISRTAADMSVCRNSTVVPLLTGRANVSFFCTGGITWGRNRADQLTSGWPLPVFQALGASWQTSLAEEPESR